MKNTTKKGYTVGMRRFATLELARKEATSISRSVGFAAIERDEVRIAEYRNGRLRLVSEVK